MLCRKNRQRSILYFLEEMLLFVFCVLTAGKVFALEIAPYADQEILVMNDNILFFDEENTVLLPAEYYGELDSLGRCTGAFAIITPDSLPTENRESVTAITPSGWQAIRLQSTGELLYNRCHLIGYQLTGQNALDRNLITGTVYLNKVLMMPYENSIAQYVSGTGNRVLYRVTPFFLGDDLVASGVLMEAQSVEDDKLQFCVFCYNIQPGVTIDYATGGVTENGQFFTLIPYDTSDRESDSDNSRALKDDYSDQPDYVVNKNTEKFHRPYCDSVKDIKQKNRWDFSGTRDELLALGYVPCKRCNP